jgi:hypothetical protein
LFALIFASSFYVHDYYALPFILPVLFYACYSLSWALNRSTTWRAGAMSVISLALVLGALLSQDATFRLTNYLAAGDEVRRALPDVADRDPQQMVNFASDFSLPVIPILSRKAGWAFNATELDNQRKYLVEHLDSPAVRAFVFYVREPGGDEWLEKWRAADPRLSAMHVVTDKSYPSEGRKGSATRIVVMKK